ncbi:MAG: YgaP family membrane protein [bacterium]
MFKKNEGATDRIIRAILGIIILVIGIYQVKSLLVLGIILIVVGAVLIITAITGFCLLYTLLGISTCTDCKK